MYVCLTRILYLILILKIIIVYFKLVVVLCNKLYQVLSFAVLNKTYLFNNKICEPTSVPRCYKTGCGCAFKNLFSRQIS